MLFTTLPFAAFFGGVFLIHWLLPPVLRRPWLLLASYLFYLQAIPQYGFLIAAMTLVNYGFGLVLGKGNALRPRGTSGRADRRPLLILAITANLATLAFFKYAALLLGAVWPLARFVGGAQSAPVVQILLPLGISFFTFEFIHYVVEVARGAPPIRNFIDFALFAAFFPTQIAGPIKRFPDWVKQIRAPTPLREVQADVAVSLILRGMAKKIIIADMLAPLVANGFDHPDRLGFLATWCAIYAFAAQIYADFSGYTDIGRGCALLLGYRVPENFRQPYRASNPADFWDRWHISLSQWLRDYLYIPLGGSRVAPWRICLNLMLTMALGGLWHGASWHFMLWGAYQGLLLVGYRLWSRGAAKALWLRGMLTTRHAVLVGRVVTFHLVCLGWVLFRATSPATIQTMLATALTPTRHDFFAGFLIVIPPVAALAGFVLLGTAIAVLWGWWAEWLRAGSRPWLDLEARLTAWQQRGEPFVRPAVLLALLLLIAIWPQGVAQRFIYFQF
jgi:alginate O-acetyltransferase complex protein AlgI